MRTLAVVFGAVVIGLLVVLAVAGVTGATAVLVTGAAVLAMIVLGNQLGGRRTPDRAPLGGPAEATGRDEATPQEATPGDEERGTEP